MPPLRRLGQTDLHIAPLVLGTNTAGWTADEATSFAVFDAFLDLGFTALDTADVYSRWVPGNDSESERIIGRWMAARGNRDRVHVLTKVGSDIGQGKRDLSAKWIMQAVEGSLSRLQTDYIDLYQSHWPDTTVAQEETLEAYDRLITAGKVRWIGCSNYDEALLTEALAVSEAKGLPRYQTVQNEYNLYNRGAYEGAVQQIVLREGLSLIPYFSLASGFLTGKYRSAEDLAQSQRGKGVEKYLTDKGMAILAALDKVAASTGATQAEVALAWVSAQAGVVGPLASATSVTQLESLARGARLHLDADDLATLTAAGA
ncbi:Predicted oxidoreductase [Gemmobacter megaterium]|uniref:Predicted oxidoreductase n=1 Tax=Gemmobacter megaterium TaxID=1086013 RepID=A0A1N7M7X7_9RHOB|nr:aldo/keto reductase [Gemmobacter megaterium]GGE08342.1 NADP-dependent aryl-alcohol dehydrogenase [Gemmobacter megaterium]SIS82187.1 Predicted oxidoreductase [Gemmobacter megaterium]